MFNDYKFNTINKQLLLNEINNDVFHKTELKRMIYDLNEYNNNTDIYDLIILEENAICMFFSKGSIQMGKNANIIGVDGTFKITCETKLYSEAKEIYQQTFIIHIIKTDDETNQSKSWPIFFATFNGKNTNTYHYILKRFCTISFMINGITPNPKYISCDYENAIIIAILNVWKYIIIIGCYMHYCKDIQSKLCSLTLKHNLPTNLQANKIKNRLFVLPYIPINLVIVYYEFIMSLFKQIFDSNSYIAFDNYYHNLYKNCIYFINF